MNLYVVNMLSDRQESHAIHTYGCGDFPNIFFEVGMFNSPKEAIDSTEKMFKKAHCCNKCISEEKKMTETKITLRGVVK